jgi:hypothetical protein
MGWLDIGMAFHASACAAISTTRAEVVTSVRFSAIKNRKIAITGVRGVLEKN